MSSYVIAKMKFSFLPDDVIDVDSAHERHFWTTSMTSIRRKRVNLQLRKTSSEARRKKLKMEATEVERQLLKSYQKSRMDCETKAVNAIKKNPKYFFSYAREFSSVKIGIGPSVDAANKLVRDS